MRRISNYSRSPQVHRKVVGSDDAQAHRSSAASPDLVPAPGRFHRLMATVRRPGWSPWLLGSVLVAALLGFGVHAIVTPPERKLTQADIDAAVLHTLKKRPPGPSAASVAYDVIRPSVVLVRRLGEDKKAKAARPIEPSGEAVDPKTFALTGVGTGVVFSDDGMIFTNLHVVAGADNIGVVFADGTESEVELLDAQPENDLAVLRAKTLPDDLRPATLRSTRGLKTGDEVLAVGFPFGIGPTATWGVVSGLRREHYSDQGRRNLIDLIQFDAAANPGNSGGPLVTRDGDVVGIVTSILNPTDEGFFVGIAFAVPIENAARAAGVSPF